MRQRSARSSARSRWLQISESWDLRSFRRQLVLSTAALSAVFGVGLVVVVQLFLAGSAVDTVDRLLDDRANVLVISIDTATRSSGALVVPATYVEPGVAVYDRDGTLVAGFVPPRQAGLYERIAGARTEQRRRFDSSFDLMARPFTTTSGTSGVVVLSERLAPYEDDEQDALLVSVVAGLVLVVVATGLAAWASRRALAPVAQMAREAEAWSEHDLDHRFGLGPPTNEIRALGHTLDGLLEKVARAIVAEQRLTSELAHELRTPLSAVQGTAELISLRTDLDQQLREDVAEIQTSCRRMASTVTGLLELARAQSTARTDDAVELRQVVEAVVSGAPHAERVTIDLQDGIRVAVPSELAVRALSPVVNNATRLAEHVRVHASASDRRVSVTVEDDGPGLAPEDAHRIFQPGVTSGSGSGLGLALARRIARSVGGDVVVALPDADGPPVSVQGRGARFVVTLPAGRDE